VIFVVKDDDEIEMPQASCRIDSSVSHPDSRLPPAEIFAADSGRVLFCYCCVEVWSVELFCSDSITLQQLWCFI